MVYKDEYIVAAWISLGFVTFAGYASCIKYQFIRMLHSKNVFIVLMLITCFTSIMLISVSHCLRFMMLFIENFVIFVVCDVFSQFHLIFYMV